MSQVPKNAHCCGKNDIGVYSRGGLSIECSSRTSRRRDIIVPVGGTEVATLICASASVLFRNVTPIATLQSTEALMTNDHNLPATTSHLPDDVTTFETSAGSGSGDCTEIAPPGHGALEPRRPELLGNPFSPVTFQPTSNHESYDKYHAWLVAKFPPTGPDVDLIIFLLAGDLVRLYELIRSMEALQPAPRLPSNWRTICEAQRDLQILDDAGRAIIDGRVPSLDPPAVSRVAALVSKWLIAYARPSDEEEQTENEDDVVDEDDEDYKDPIDEAIWAMADSEAARGLRDASRVESFLSGRVKLADPERDTLLKVLEVVACQKDGILTYNRREIRNASDADHAARCSVPADQLLKLQKLKSQMEESIFRRLERLDGKRQQAVNARAQS